MNKKTSIRDVRLVAGPFIIETKRGEIRMLRGHDNNIDCNVGGLVTYAWCLQSHELLTGEETGDYHSLIKGLKDLGVTIREITPDIMEECKNEMLHKELSGGHWQWDSEFGDSTDGDVGIWQDYIECLPDMSKNMVRTGFENTGINTENMWHEFYADNADKITGMIKSGLERCETLNDLDDMFQNIEGKAEKLVVKTVKKLKARAIRAHTAEKFEQARRSAPTQEAI